VQIVYATSTANVGLPNGVSGVVQQGTHWPADDPIVLANPSLFSPDPRYGLRYSQEPEGYGDPVEQATSAPGEKRNVRRG
jgi:hypothetical protein